MPALPSQNFVPATGRGAKVTRRGGITTTQVRRGGGRARGRGRVHSTSPRNYRTESPQRDCSPDNRNTSPKNAPPPKREPKNAPPPKREPQNAPAPKREPKTEPKNVPGLTREISDQRASKQLSAESVPKQIIDVGLLGVKIAQLTVPNAAPAKVHLIFKIAQQCIQAMQTFVLAARNGVATRRMRILPGSREDKKRKRYIEMAIKRFGNHREIINALGLQFTSSLEMCMTRKYREGFSTMVDSALQQGTDNFERSLERVPPDDLYTISVYLEELFQKFLTNLPTEAPPIQQRSKKKKGKGRGKKNKINFKDFLAM